MYLEHFGLRESPFRITPHTDFFFDGADRGATLDALLYTVLHEEGIVKVSGEVGSGKTMLCRMLIDRLPPEVDTVYLANPSLSREEIMQAIAEDLNVEYPRDSPTAAMRELVARLIELHATGRRAVILIDEAHAMPAETLEQVRLLSNLETRRHKLLQIVLFGQPELDATLDAPSMRQLKDRITHSFRTRPLDAGEASRYLGFRMRAAGYKGPDVFSPKAVAMMTRAASGLTRRLNILADKALLAAFTDNRHAVNAPEVRAAIRDSEFARLGTRTGPRARIAWGALAALAAGVLIAYAAYRYGATDAALQTAAGPAPVPTAPTAAPAAQAADPPAPAAAAKPETPPPAAEPLPAPVAPDPPPKPAAGLLGAEATRRMAGYRAEGNKLLAERLAATRTLLDSQRDGRYSLELFVTENSDPARTERFLQRARDLVDLADLYVVPFAAAGRYRIGIVYGSFPDRGAAEEAARRLPPKYRQAFQPTPRSIEELRRGL